MTPDSSRQVTHAAAAAATTKVGGAMPVIPGLQAVRLIATGGMGAVFEATQEFPQRSVAVKVMKCGATTLSGLRRFQEEARILARLRHPGIAQIYDAGACATSEGAESPYFVMEYIPDALTIRDYAERHRLDVSDRLSLFVQVCDAVHHGHQKGVIHRDLKPGNILVGDDGQVKIIDFGVARVIDQQVQEVTMHTQEGNLIGTIRYMSPEQASGEVGQVDTRSDVYALGVVLYELLTGRLPYDMETSNIFEAARRIRFETPQRIGSVNRALRGDLETIVHKALEKDREARYASADALARDIERCVAGRPISARPTSAWYQFRLMARRRPLATLMACGAILATTVYGVINARLAYEARQQWRQAVESRRRADESYAAARAGAELLLHGVCRELPKIANVGATQRELLDVAWKHHIELAALCSDDPEQKVGVASSFRELGGVYALIQDSDRAGDAFGRAFELAASAVADSPSDSGLGVEAVLSADAAATLLRSIGDFDGAAIWRRRVLDYYSGIAAVAVDAATTLDLRLAAAEAAAGLGETAQSGVFLDTAATLLPKGTDIQRQRFERVRGLLAESSTPQ